MEIRCCVVAGLASVSMALASPAWAQAHLSPPEIEKRVDVVANYVLAKPETAGLGIAVARGGSLVLERGYGFADIENGVPVTDDTVFHIGSVSKLLSAAATMKLVEEGKLSLDEPVATYLPDFDMADGTITVRHLLNQSSGLPRVFLGNPDAPKSYDEAITDADIFAMMEKMPMAFEPGERFQYANINAWILGHVISAASGRDFREYMEDFFRSNDLASIQYGSASKMIPNRADGYEFDLKAGALRNASHQAMVVPGASGGFASTAGDLARFMAALVDGRLVSDQSFSQMTGDMLPTGEGGEEMSWPDNVSHGFNIRGSTIAGHDAFDFGGHIEGYNAFVAHLPNADLTIAVTTNTGRMIESHEILKVLAEALVSDEMIELGEGPQKGSREALDRMLAALRSDEPDYSFIAGIMRSFAAAMHPRASKALADFGPMEDLQFVRSTMGGPDIYVGQFETQRVMFLPRMTDDRRLRSFDWMVLPDVD